MTPLLLLPGMMCDARLWAPQLAAFSHERAVMCAPLPGETTAEMAGSVLSHAPPRFALAGLSMGGIVAMEIVHRAPERVERLALLDTNPLAERPEVAARRGPQIEAVRAGRLREVMRDEMKPNYLAPGPRRAEVLATVMEMAMAAGPAAFEAQSRALMSRPDRTAALAAYPGPALVLCGRHDALCPVERHEAMAALLRRSEIAVIEGAGHLPTLEKPEATNAALGRWLSARQEHGTAPSASHDRRPPRNR